MEEKNTTYEEALENEKALKDFLLDIDCLNQLYERADDFNIFDILKITRVEIRHSNLLAWLLTPNENHGLDDSIIKGFIQFSISKHPSDNNYNILKTLLIDFSTFKILREWQHIDILAISEKEKYLLCIENKIDTGEHDNQLNRYQQVLDKKYPEYKKNYIYLSPDGSTSSLPDKWISMSYTDVIDIIEKALKNKKLLPEAEMLINNYLKTIRRNIVEDTKLTEICNEIYKKHKKALDLIFEKKIDRTYEVSKYFINWCNKKSEDHKMTLVIDKCNKKYIRFKTDTMTKILPDAENPDSAWGTKNYYFYEIVNNGDNFYIQLALNSQRIPNDLYEICNTISKHSNCRKNKNWNYCYPFKSKPEDIDLDMTEEELHNILDKELKKIRKFEEGLNKEMGI